MANMRKKGKKKVSFWLNEEERKLLKDASDAMELNMSDVVRMLLIENARKKGLIK